MNELIVFSGGPYSGKTTTLEIFKKNGHTVIKEAALDVINKLTRDLGVKEQQEFMLNNPLYFQNLVFEKQIENEKSILTKKHKNNIIFLDRSVLDGFAYLHYNKVLWGAELYNFIPKYKYNEIFIFETLSNFKNRKDSGRVENNKEDSLAIKNSILFTYKFFGYKPHLVFEKIIDERVAEIKLKLQVDFS